MPSTFKDASAHATTSLTSIYTVPADGTTVIVGAQAANVHVAATPLDANVDVAILRAATSETYYLVKNLTVPVGSAIDVVTGKVVLSAGDAIQVRADIETAIDLVASVLEMT